MNKIAEIKDNNTLCIDSYKITLKPITRQCSIYNLSKSYGKLPKLNNNKIITKSLQKLPILKEYKSEQKIPKLRKTNKLDQLIAKNIEKLTHIPLNIDQLKLKKKENVIQDHINKVKEAVKSSYAMLNSYENKKLQFSPDRRIRKYISRMRNFAIPKEPTIPKTYFSERNIKTKRVNIRTNEEVGLESPFKRGIMKKSSLGVYEKIRQTLQNTQKLEVEGKKKYEEIAQRYDICDGILKNIQLDQNESADGNGSLEFYIWQTAKSRKKLSKSVNLTRHK